MNIFRTEITNYFMTQMKDTFAVVNEDRDTVDLVILQHDIVFKVNKSVFPEEIVQLAIFATINATERNKTTT